MGTVLYHVERNDVSIRLFKSFDGARKWAHKNTFLGIDDIAVLEVDANIRPGYITRLWKWNNHRKRFQRANPDTKEWLLSTKEKRLGYKQNEPNGPGVG